MGRPPKPVMERLLKRRVVTREGCWEYDKPSATCGGYQQVSVGTVDGKPLRKYAHRVAYEHLVGPIPSGMQIDHLCRNRGCFNPEHLEPVTPRENILRSVAHITHCPQGHEYTAQNTGYTGNRRYCRECKRAKALARYYASKETA